MILTKGVSATYAYSSTDFPVLTSDWVGSVSVYATYPGVVTATLPLMLGINVKVLNISPGDLTTIPCTLR